MSLSEKSGTRRFWRGAHIALVATVMLGIGTSIVVDGHDAAAKRRDRRTSAEISAEAVIRTFSNPTQLAIASNAQTAPSTIAVSGLNTPIADVAVTLTALSHPTAGDLDVLLVGPGGQAVLLMSEAGDDAANDSLTFDDQAAAQLPLSNELTSGVFQPTDYDFTGAPDAFAAPAPTDPNIGSSLGIFNGTNANGTWTLFIREQDNVPPETGNIAGGWSLRITAANGVPSAAPDNFQAQAGRTLTVPANGVLGNDTDPDDDPLTAVLADQPAKGSVILAPDGSFSYRATRKARGADSFTYLAKDSSGLQDLETVTIQIKGKKIKKKQRK
jgi:subtilisin-like proprotein convertase family protein